MFTSSVNKFIFFPSNGCIKHKICSCNMHVHTLSSEHAGHKEHSSIIPGGRSPAFRILPRSKPRDLTIPVPVESDGDTCREVVALSLGPVDRQSSGIVTFKTSTSHRGMDTTRADGQEWFFLQ